MSSDASPSEGIAPVAGGEPTASLAVERSRGGDLLVGIATDRQRLLVVLIVTLVVLMAIVNTNRTR